MEALPDLQNEPPIILIVEDNAAIRHVIRWALPFNGYQSAEAANGLEALTWMELAARERRFASLILLDLVMPAMNGQAFLVWLQTSWLPRYPIPPVILFTAERLDERALFFPACVKQIVAKPFHVSDLLEVIRKWSG